MAGNLTDAQVAKVVDDIITALLQDLGQLTSGADEAETQKVYAVFFISNLPLANVVQMTFDNCK